jgi:hypothetical protein
MATRSPDDIALPALAAQVADLRGTVTVLKARMDAAGVSGSARLHEQVAELSRIVAGLCGEGTPSRPAAPSWAGLDPEARAARLAALAAWVDGFLIPNYRPEGLRSCWAAHMAAVWELSTLHAEWERIYDRKHPELAGALTWHDRWLPGAVSRLEKILKDCKARCSAARAPAPSRPRPGAG